ncbi:hypothetical protein HYU19_03785 [Candidatus Woesearchaeota archaeon]|nr:hypothetical protein [Candidatus Woesearchaeota archaeon]
MKPISMIWTLFLLLALLASAVSADLTLSVTEIAFGGENQARSNPLGNADDPQDLISNATIRVTLTNTDATSSVTNLAHNLLSTNAPYYFTVSEFPASLSANGAKEFTITARVPENLDAIDSNFKLLKKAIGNFKVTGVNSTSSETISTPEVPMTIQAENMLEIKDVELCFRGKCKSPDDGDDVKDMKPGDAVDLTIIVENKYSERDEEDLQIEDIDVNIEAADRDLNVDEEETIDDINPKDENDVSVSFDIEDDTPHGGYNLVIRASGKDENGALMGEEWTIELKVERERHDILIEEVTLTPESISCAEVETTVRNAQAYVQYQNIGQHDEKDVVIELKIPDLGIVEAVRDIELDEDNEETEILSFGVPAGTKPGVYGIEVRTFYDNTKLSDLMEKTVTVSSDCEGNGEQDSEPAQANRRTQNAQNGGDERGDIIVVPPPQQPPAVIPPKQPVTPPTQVNESNSLAYVIGLGVVVLVLVIVLAVLLVTLFRKRH